MGATLPIVFHEIKKDLQHIGQHSGNIFSFNTLGSLAGCLIGGIILYHFLDIREIFLVSVCMASVSAWLASKTLPRRFFYLTSALLPVVAVITLAAPWYTKTNDPGGLPSRLAEARHLQGESAATVFVSRPPAVF